MINNIEVGDIVDVIFTRNNVFDWQQSLTIGDCRVIKIPYETGDTFGFVYDDDDIKRKIFINPSCSDFVGVEFIRGKESESWDLSKYESEKVQNGE